MGRKGVWETRHLEEAERAAGNANVVGEKLEACVSYIMSFISVISPSCHGVSKQRSRTDTVCYNSVSDICLPTIYGNTLSHFDCTIAWKWIYFFISSSQILGRKFKEANKNKLKLRG